MKQPTMNDDIAKYPVYMLHNKQLISAQWIQSTSNYNHYVYQLNHFIRKSVRKNSPEFYKRVEHLQKLILMPAQMNYDLETMGEESFKNKWGIEKDLLVFNRKKWRSGFYESTNDNGAEDL